MKKVRKDVRIPEVLVKQIDEYKTNEGVSTWTAALLELARKGLDAYKKEQDKQNKSGI